MTLCACVFVSRQTVITTRDAITSAWWRSKENAPWPMRCGRGMVRGTGANDDGDSERGGRQRMKLQMADPPPFGECGRAPHGSFTTPRTAAHQENSVHTLEVNSEA